MQNGEFNVKAVIFCSGEIRDYEYYKKLDFSDCLIICADNGYSHTKKIGIVPDVIIGDNDSYKEEYPSNIKHYIYPPEKDDTDTGIAVNYAIELGCTDIILCGGLGGRIDQEFSHFCLMKYALDKDVRLTMIDDINEIWMENKSFTLSGGGRKYVSFFPYGGEVENVSIRGFKYEAEDITLSPGLVQASSNEFLDGVCGSVDFDNGTIIVMLCDDRM